MLGYIRHGGEVIATNVSHFFVGTAKTADGLWDWNTAAVFTSVEDAKDFIDNGKQAFTNRRSHHRWLTGLVLVALAEAGMSMVDAGGRKELSEAHYDAHSNLERDVRAGMTGGDHAFAMAMMGGEPYGNWY